LGIPNLGQLLKSSHCGIARPITQLPALCFKAVFSPSVSKRGWILMPSPPGAQLSMTWLVAASFSYSFATSSVEPTTCHITPRNGWASPARAEIPVHFGQHGHGNPLPASACVQIIPS
jgi:hypothetical protein